MRGGRILAWILLWIFALFALGSVGNAVAQRIKHPGGRMTLYSATINDGLVVRSWGLTYAGTRGTLVAVGQFMGSVAAMMMLFRRGRWRMLGTVLLTSWALFWTLSVGRVIRIGGDFGFFGPWWSIMLVGFLAGLFLLVTWPRRTADFEPVSPAIDS